MQWKSAEEVHHTHASLPLSNAGYSTKGRTAQSVETLQSSAYSPPTGTRAATAEGRDKELYLALYVSPLVARWHRALDLWSTVCKFDSRPLRFWLGQVVRTRASVTMLYQFGTSVSWEGNHRSGVTLAMHQTIVVLPPTGSWPWKGQWPPCLRSIWSTATSSLPLEATALTAHHCCSQSI